MDASRLEMEDERILGRMVELFDALGDSTRLRILHALFDVERCVGEISSRLSTTDSAVSHQLRRLKDLHLVKSRRVGKNVYYSLDDEHVRRLFADGLEHVLERR